MGKRIQLIPLLGLLFCSGIGFSSGLYYSEINEMIYPLYVFVMAAFFYLFLFFFRRQKRKAELSCLASLAILVLGSGFLFSVLKPGFLSVLNRISDLTRISAGFDLGAWENADNQYAGLAMSHIMALLTVITLYFFEAGCPAFVTVLPSFVLFMLPIMVDGVPHEICFICWGMCILVLIGMGCRGQSVRKLLILLAGSVLAGALAAVFLPWDRVGPALKAYQEQAMEQPWGVFGGFPVSGKKTEEKEQKIHYGQFDRQGDITYQGTVELVLTTKKNFSAGQLFLCGYIGNVYKDNTWTGDAPEFYGNAIDGEPGITVTKQFDTGDYVLFSVNQKRYDKLLKRKVSERQESDGSVDETTREVSASLKKRIEDEILPESPVRTVKEAVEYVQDYFQDGYEYTLHPGSPTQKKDEIETFLFERKTGYCTHFASSAVMIFRTMGIPARMAEGYVVSGSRISPGTDTNVYDSDAHAWAEIYMDGAGWVPVEVTPSRVESTEGAESAEQESAAPDAEVSESTESKSEDFPFSPAPQKSKMPVPRDNNMAEDSDSVEKNSGAGGGQGQISYEYRAFFLLALAFLGLFSAAAAERLLHRRIRCESMKKRLAKEAPSRRLLTLNKGMEPVWEKLGAPWSYADSGKMAEDLFQRTRKFYVFGISEESKLLKNQISDYVMCVYRAKYDGQALSEDEYEMCQRYLCSLLFEMKRSLQRKSWKKVFGTPGVRVITKNGGERHE